jgi:hypothetical protein
MAREKRARWSAQKRPVGRERWRLADRADGDHPVCCQTLERAHRLAVVPELGVVLVLDDVAVALGGPVDQREGADVERGRLRWAIGARG